MVLNKNDDLLKSVSLSFFKKYKNDALVIREIEYHWNENMEDLQKKGCTETQILNTKKKGLTLTL